MTSEMIHVEFSRNSSSSTCTQLHLSRHMLLIMSYALHHLRMLGWEIWWDNAPPNLPSLTWPYLQWSKFDKMPVPTKAPPVQVDALQLQVQVHNALNIYDGTMITSFKALKKVYRNLSRPHITHYRAISHCRAGHQWWVYTWLHVNPPNDYVLAWSQPLVLHMEEHLIPVAKFTDCIWNIHYND